MKYEFTGETLEHRGRTLRRIRRLSDGVLGGWIEKEENLSQEGGCWVDDEAKVCGDARVCEDAWVYGEAWVYGVMKYVDVQGLGVNHEVSRTQGRLVRVGCFCEDHHRDALWKVSWTSFRIGRAKSLGTGTGLLVEECRSGSTTQGS